MAKRPSPSSWAWYRGEHEAAGTAVHRGRGKGAEAASPFSHGSSFSVAAIIFIEARI